MPTGAGPEAAGASQGLGSGARAGFCGQGSAGSAGEWAVGEVSRGRRAGDEGRWGPAGVQKRGLAACPGGPGEQEA